MNNVDDWESCATLYKTYFEDNNRISSKRVFPFIITHLQTINGKKILDFGCGQGRFSRKLYDLGAKVTAFDTSKNEIKIAKDINENRKIKYLNNFNQVKKQKYDYILCFMVLLCNNRNDLTKILDELCKLLNKNGKIIAVNTNTATLGKKFKDFYSKKSKNKMRNGQKYKTYIPTRKGTIIVDDYFYTKKYLKNKFEQNKLGIECEKIINEQFLVSIVMKN